MHGDAWPAHRDRRGRAKSVPLPDLSSLDPLVATLARPMHRPASVLCHVDRLHTVVDRCNARVELKLEQMQRRAQRSSAVCAGTPERLEIQRQMAGIMDMVSQARGEVKRTAASPRPAARRAWYSESRREWSNVARNPIPLRKSSHSGEVLEDRLMGLRASIEERMSLSRNVSSVVRARFDTARCSNHVEDNLNVRESISRGNRAGPDEMARRSWLRNQRSWEARQRREAASRGQQELSEILNAHVSQRLERADQRKATLLESRDVARRHEQLVRWLHLVAQGARAQCLITGLVDSRTARRRQLAVDKIQRAYRRFRFCRKWGRFTGGMAKAAVLINRYTIWWRRNRRGESAQILVTFLFECGSMNKVCLLYTSDAADEEDSVDLGGRRIIKQKYKKNENIQRILNYSESASTIRWTNVI
eukprot:TRINITY_DN10095_c0_g2_i1.p1 TRINITY_DN10095_c0_g2~~TRINITY_DN10095_c0_g2_i1.p1  ORF type:complete len:420 (+),score=69.00 TRINITY_DN10095_c0_g2_i1:1-1260(+)